MARVRIATGRCGFESHLNRTCVEDRDWWNLFGLQLHPAQLDRHLIWTAHCEKVKRTVNFGIASINRIKDGMSLSQRVVLYNALIQPHFDYCASVWSSDSAKVQSDLCTTQRKAVRALYNYSSKVRSDEFMAQNNSQSLKDKWKKKKPFGCTKRSTKNGSLYRITWSIYFI